MKYDPNKHNRKSIRLKGYDYSKEGLYFVTLCCHDKIHRFGKIKKEKMVLNQNGIIADIEWKKLKQRFPKFQLDVFQIMPNHIHTIVSIVNVMADLPVPSDKSNPAFHQKIIKNKTLDNIIGAYKSLVFKHCLEVYKSNNTTMGKFWQRSYHDRIIRNDGSYENISNYIINNPKNWDKDRFNR